MRFGLIGLFASGVLFPTALLTPLSAQVLEIESTVYSFGELDGPETEVIGEITDLAASQDGDILVLDGHAQRVGWIRPGNELGGWFGKRGDGPQEFSYANAVDFRGDDFLVSDPGHQRIIVLEGGPGGLRFRRAIPVDVIVQDFCVLNDRLYVLGLAKGSIIHEFDWQGQHLQSFGSPTSSAADVSERWQQQVDLYSVRGRLTCIPQKDRIVVVTRILPQIRAYTSSGDLAWTHQLSPWKETTITETRDGRVQLGLASDDGAFHTAVSSFSWAPEFVAVQVVEAHMGRTSPDAQIAVETRFLDSDTGALVARQYDLPRTNAYVQDRLVSWQTLPFPQLQLIRVKN